MSAHRPGRHSPWRTPDEHPHPHLVAVRQADWDRYEVTLSPGAGVADLVAAAGILPRGVVYNSHCPANPKHEQPTAAILVFQKLPIDPADTGDPGGMPAHPFPSGGPLTSPARLLAEGTPNPASDVPASVEEASPPRCCSPSLGVTSSTPPHLTHTSTTGVHPTVFPDNPAKPPTASDDTARLDQQAA